MHFRVDALVRFGVGKMDWNDIITIRPVKRDPGSGDHSEAAYSGE